MTATTVAAASAHGPGIDPPAVTPDFESGVFYATSRTHPDVQHTLGATVTPAGQVRVTCTCPAGRKSRPDRRPVPCRHARAVCRLLAGHGLVRQETCGCWKSVQPAVAA